MKPTGATKEARVKPQEKWIIDDSRIGPSREWVVLIPRVFPDDDDYYFFRAQRTIVPATHVFDTAQEAAAAFARITDNQINDLKNISNRVREWAENLNDNAALNEVEG